MIVEKEERQINPYVPRSLLQQAVDEVLGKAGDVLVAFLGVRVFKFSHGNIADGLSITVAKEGAQSCQADEEDRERQS